MCTGLLGLWFLTCMVSMTVIVNGMSAQPPRTIVVFTQDARALWDTFAPQLSGLFRFPLFLGQLFPGVDGLFKGQLRGLRSEIHIS
jgi:hypothetical protein